MASTTVSTFQKAEDIAGAVKDLRTEEHPEYGDTEDLVRHLRAAEAQNGLKEYSREIYEELLAYQPEAALPGWKHLYHLAGNAKGIVKYRMRHGKSSFSRYREHHYTPLEVLRSLFLTKHQHKIYEMPLGLHRLQFRDSLAQLCEGVAKPKILEAGCGAGTNLYLMHSHDATWDLHGFEYTHARLASAAVNLFNTPVIKNLFLGDVCQLNLPDGAFDVIYSNHVLEQLGQERAAQAVREMWRVSRRGIVVCEPSIHGANAYEKWRMRTLGYCEDLYAVAKELKGAKILSHEEDVYRTYPNTSYHLVVRKEG